MSNAVKHWTMQRISAVALLFLMPWMIYFFIQVSQKSFPIMMQGWNKPLLILTYSLLAYHLKLGLEVIIQDYVPQKQAQTWAMRITAWVIGFLWLLGILSMTEMTVRF